MSIFNDLFPLISLSKQSGIEVGGGGKGGERGCGAASAKLCYEIIWFINWVDNGNWPP